MRQKTLLFIAALLVIGQSVCAREYLPMLKEGKQWMYYYTNQHYECNYYFTLNGDTVIDGKTWHKVYERMVDQWTGTDIIRERYAGAMFEEDGRVYRFTKNVQKKEMLCDFNLEVGDKTSEGNWEVTDIGNTYAFGKTRKCLTLRRVNEEPYLHHVEYWIEGIGSSNTFVDSSISFLACYEDNRCVFTNANFTDMPDAKVTPEHDQLISEGRQWWYKNYDTNISVDGVDSRMVMKGDTTIAGNTWKKLYYIETPGSVPVYRKALREDGSRVYELPAGGQERLLLDFTLGIGDRYSPDGSEDRYLEVVGVDTVLSAGIARRRLILQQYVNNIETNLSTWTEGVGSECGVDQPAFWSNRGTLYQNGHHTTDYYWLAFSGCSDKNGHCIYGTIPSIEAQTDKTEINETTFPDSNFRKWVLSQDYGADGVLTNEELENVISIDISRLEIHDLKGIEYFTALKDLNCMTNKLTTLNLSKNTALEKLDCGGNRLTTINLLENRKLRSLKCGGISLTSLDVSNCTELDTLACSGNPLKTLDVSKNTKLRCLECYSNLLTSLDLSKNTALRRLHCNNNQLTTLDVSKNTALTLLECSKNMLTTLDVTTNSALVYLSCTDNKLTTLSVSGNKSLESIICLGNQLTSLDVSGCSALKSLGCGNNQLTMLDLSGCSALEGVTCYGNQLTTLDLSENTALTVVSCYKNQIKGIGMDALVESLPTVSEGRLYIMYFENEQNVMTTTQVAAAKAKGWSSYYWNKDAYNWVKYAGSETPQMAYLPFVEDGKVWKVGDDSGNPVQRVEYYYFDGDTIIDGKSCKQMMCQRYVSPDHPDYNVISRLPSLSYVGAWYEEDKKVYYFNAVNKQFRMMYDFSLDANDTLLIDNSSPYVVGPRQTGGIKGFKGVYRDVMMVWDEEQSIYNTTWLEGIGSIEGPGYNVYLGKEYHGGAFLMSCTVGDEVIYLNDDYEDGATPDAMNARKQRIDFTHTIKVRPKAPSKNEAPRRAAEESLYGEYNDVQLGINLNPLDDAYLVRITDETGKSVYEKAVNAGSIVGLNIDISAYPKGRYTVTVENGSESFTGEFEAQTTGIVENLRIEKLENGSIFDLQGRRLSGKPAKGVYIENGRKRMK